MERSHGSIKPPAKQPIKEIQARMILGASAVSGGTPVGPARTGSRDASLEVPVSGSLQQLSWG